MFSILESYPIEERYKNKKYAGYLSFDPSNNAFSDSKDNDEFSRDLEKFFKFKHEQYVNQDLYSHTVTELKQKYRNVHESLILTKLCRFRLNQTIDTILDIIGYCGIVLNIDLNVDPYLLTGSYYFDCIYYFNRNGVNSFMDSMYTPTLKTRDIILDFCLLDLYKCSLNYDSYEHSFSRDEYFTTHDVEIILHMALKELRAVKDEFHNYVKTLKRKGNISSNCDPSNYNVSSLIKETLTIGESKYCGVDHQLSVLTRDVPHKDYYRCLNASLKQRKNLCVHKIAKLKSSPRMENAVDVISHGVLHLYTLLMSRVKSDITNTVETFLNVHSIYNIHTSKNICEFLKSLQTSIFMHNASKEIDILLRIFDMVWEALSKLKFDNEKSVEDINFIGLLAIKEGFIYFNQYKPSVIIPERSYIPPRECNACCKADIVLGV